MERAPLPMDVIVYIKVNDFITKLLPNSFANLSYHAIYIALPILTFNPLPYFLKQKTREWQITIPGNAKRE